MSISSTHIKHRVALALGGNIGDPKTSFQQAIELLQGGGLRDISQASLLETIAVDCEPGTPNFLNSALIGLWPGTPLELLRLCQQIERQLGRPAQHSSRASRTLDLDLLLFDDQQVRLQELIIPHPRLRQRQFVLEPLQQIAPDWPVPPDGKTVRQLWRELQEKMP